MRNDSLHKNANAIQRYEACASHPEELYFTEKEFEEIICHFISRKQPDAARKAISRALCLHPMSANLMIKKVEYLLLTDCIELSQKNIRQATEILNCDICETLTKGDTLLAMGKEQEAAELLTQLSLCRTDNTTCLLWAIASVFSLHSMPGVALRFLHSARDEASTHRIEVATLEAMCESLLHNGERSKKIYNKIIDTEPYTSGAWLQLGHAHFRDGEYDNALYAYDYANITASAPNPHTELLMAECYEQKECYQKALDLYIKHNSEGSKQNAYLLVKMANCHGCLDHCDSEKSCYSTATQIEPNCPDAWAGLAQCNCEADNTSEAIPLALKAISLNPDESYYWMVLGHAYLAEAETEKALNAFEKNRALATGDQMTTEIIAEIKFQLKRYDEALEELNKINTTNDIELSNRKETLLAATYYMKGDKLAANEKLTIAILNEETNADLFFDLCPKAKRDKDFKNFQKK